MTFDELETALGVMLKAFRVNYKIDRLIKAISVQFVAVDFGVVITGFVAEEYKLVKDSTEQAYPDHRRIYIAHSDNMLEKKDDVLWALMQSGYMHWLRTEYNRDFRNFVIMQEFGKKIINKRLEIWADQAKYRYLVNYNKSALTQPATYMLSIDPAFYDYMPE